MLQRYSISFLSLLAFSFFLSITVRAQQDAGRPPHLFKDVSQTASALQGVQAERLSVLENNPSTKGTKIIQLPEKIANTPVFALHFRSEDGFVPASPGRSSRQDTKGHVVHARQKNVYVLSDTRYAWEGILYARRPETGKDEKVGTITLIQQKGGEVTGSIRVGSDHFKVRSLGQGLHALVDIDESKIPNPEGPTASLHERAEGDPSGPENNAKLEATKDTSSQRIEPNAISCPVEEQKILVVYTSDAASGRNPGSIAALAVQEANQAYGNSNVNDLDLELAHTEQVGITESSTGDGRDRIQDDLNSLKNSLEVSNLRNQYHADLVVLLTAGDYLVPNGQITGRADVINAFQPNEAFAVVDIDFATSGSYTLPHEVGHLQGGQHHPDDSDPISRGYAYGFGHRFSDWNWFPPGRDYYATTMAYTTSNHSRIDHFSNPNVSVDSEPTGIEGERDNAQVLRTTANRIADFLTPNGLKASFVASGDPQTGAYTFTSQSCGGAGSYSYEWYISQDPYAQGNLVSTSSSFSTTLPTGMTSYVTLEVQSGDGQTESTTRSFYITGCEGDEIICEASASTAPTAKTLQKALQGAGPQPQEFALHGAGPNPFRQSTEIAFTVPEATDVTVVVYDILGREVGRLVDARHAVGTHRVRLDAGGLSSGTYIVRMKAGDFVQSKKITVVE